MYIISRSMDKEFRDKCKTTKNSLITQEQIFRMAVSMQRKPVKLDKISMLETPSVLKLLDTLEKELCTKYRYCGVTKKSLEALVKLDYDVFMKNVVKIQQRVPDVRAAEDIFSCLDNYYGIRNSHKFVVDTKDLKKFYSSDFADLSDITEEDLDKFGDMTIDFYHNGKYLNMSLKSLRGTYKIVIQGVEHKVVNLALNSSVKGEMGNLWSATLIKDRYPRLYMDTSDNSNKCSDCEHRNEKEYKNIAALPDSGRVIKLDTRYCMVGKLRCDQCFCNDKFIPAYTDDNLGFDIPLDIHTMIKVWSHVILSYKNRDNLYRKNSRNIGLRKKAEVHTVRQNNGKYGVLSLKSYTEYEKKERKEWQGGHHSSPVEHERRGHIRRYRDENGKVVKEVFVRGSTVNKGGRTGIYKVK